MSKDKKTKEVTEKDKKVEVCEECGGKVSEDGSVCENCGAEIEQGDIEKDPDMHTIKNEEDIDLDGWDDDEEIPELDSDEDGMYS